MHCRQFPHTLLIASGRFELGRHAALTTVEALGWPEVRVLARCKCGPFDSRNRFAREHGGPRHDTWRLGILTLDAYERIQPVVV